MDLKVAHTKISALKDQVSPAEWEARVDLAAAYRYVAFKDWNSGIFNHISLRVPDEPNLYLMKPHDLLFDEVTASSLIKIDLNGERMGYGQNVNPAGYALHSVVLAARPDINAVCHVHTETGQAIAARKGGLRFLCQTSLRFYNRIAYHDFEGVAGETGEHESERLTKDLGMHQTMILRNHGLLTCGTTMAQSVFSLECLLDAMEVQLRLEATGAEISDVPPEVCEKVAERPESTLDGSIWRALMRQMDRVDASYRN